ncbi:purine-nucleoside phosphorylase [Candidatus Uhrbacteria bacterium]|nr:purine-nucleoside phosphorylase [Candidatus Uhrbacteria bacterium]
MSVHIGAEKGAIAPIVLLPGDPLRAERIAREMLEDAVCYNRVRGMLGYTGQFIAPNGQRIPVSVQGSGMGMPTLSIYVNELFNQFDVQTIVRVGTCGALQEGMKPGNLVIAQGACSDSNLNRRRFNGLDFAPLANAQLLICAVLAAHQRGWNVRMGNVLSTDLFYADHSPDEWKMWAAAGVLAVEMETAELYTLAARKNRRALSILTVSDVLHTKEAMTAQERETSFHCIVELALVASFAPWTINAG